MSAFKGLIQKAPSRKETAHVSPVKVGEGLVSKKKDRIQSGGVARRMPLPGNIGNMHQSF